MLETAEFNNLVFTKSYCDERPSCFVNKINGNTSNKTLKKMGSLSACGSLEGFPCTQFNQNIFIDRRLSCLYFQFQNL